MRAQQNCYKLAVELCRINPPAPDETPFPFSRPSCCLPPCMRPQVLVLRKHLSRRLVARSCRRLLHASPTQCRNRLLFEPAELQRDNTTGDRYVQLRVGDARGSHIDNVLRGSAGQTLRVGVLDGCAATATLSGNGSCGWRLCLGPEQQQQAPPPPPPCDVLLALPRPKVMRRLWSTLACAGVGALFVANAARVERCYFDSDVSDAPAVRAQLVRGLEQAGDTRLPPVLLSRRLPPVVDAAAGSRSWADAGLEPEPPWARWLVGGLDTLPPPPELLLVGHPGAAGTGVRAALASSARGPPRRVLLAVGPEGGWTEHELGVLLAAGGSLVSLGSRTMDTSTAVLSLLAATREALGRWDDS